MLKLGRFFIGVSLLFFISSHGDLLFIIMIWGFPSKCPLFNISADLYTYKYQGRGFLLCYRIAFCFRFCFPIITENIPFLLLSPSSSTPLTECVAQYSSDFLHSIPFHSIPLYPKYQANTGYDGEMIPSEKKSARMLTLYI